MLRLFFISFLSLIVWQNAAQAEDLYTYTKITCRPDLEYLQIDAVTEDISPDAEESPSQYYVGKKGVTLEYGGPKRKEDDIPGNRYLTNYQVYRLLFTSNGDTNNPYSEEASAILAQNGVTKHPTMTREERVAYIRDVYGKGIKEPYECKFKDKTVTVKEKVYPEQKNKCGEVNTALLIYEDTTPLEEFNFFISKCYVPAGVIYNNRGTLTRCNGDKKGCDFFSLEELRKMHRKNPNNAAKE